MEESKGTGQRGRRWPILGGIAAVVLVVAAFFGGRASIDTHGGDLSRLEGEKAKVGDELSTAEQDLASADSEVGSAEAETAQMSAKLGETEEALAAERGFKGADALAKQEAKQEYDTDFPWEAAGRAGDYTFKPIGWDHEGDNWVLTVEAKNEGHEPKLPFCGGGEAIVADAEQNEYSGEAFLGSGSASCGSELQPGLTQTYKAQFKLPGNATPVLVAIYGDYEQEEDAKTWELPR